MLCLEANASALPKTMQFTTISGTNIPRDFESAGKYAFMVSSTIVTKVAMMTIKQGILIFEGIKFLIEETIILDPKSTNVAATPMPNPFKTLVETARVGHNPRASLNVGFSIKIPFENSRKSFFIF